METTHWPGIAIGVLLGTAVSGFAVDAAFAAPPQVLKGFYSLNTPVETIAADARGKAILDRDLPGLMTSPKYPMFSDMSLAQLAPLSNGKLSQASLSKVQTDLMKLSFQEASEQ